MSRQNSRFDSPVFVSTVDDAMAPAGRDCLQISDLWKGVDPGRGDSAHREG
jgi:hypothetical protein